MDLKKRKIFRVKKKKTKKEIHPEDKTGRIYKRTKEGEKVAKELNNV